MAKFIVKVSGSIELEATSKEQAERLARTHPALGCYCGFHAREVGKDCDELGWDLPPQVPDVRVGRV